MEKKKTWGEKMKDTTDLIDELLVIRKTCFSDKRFLINKFFKKVISKINFNEDD